MEVTELLEKAQQAMEKSYAHAQDVFNTFRADRIDPAMIKDVSIDHYGVPTPLYQVATISVENPTTLTVKPWEKKLLVEIMKVMSKQAQNDFTLAQKTDHIELYRRPLTTERREEMVKTLAGKTEEVRIAIRNTRKLLKQESKTLTDEDALKLLEGKLQELTDSYIQKLDKLYKAKQAEIMNV